MFTNVDPVSFIADSAGQSAVKVALFENDGFMSVLLINSYVAVSPSGPAPIISALFRCIIPPKGWNWILGLVSEAV